ncbi:MAG TPA: dethiobiotin synthase [Candidatus Competibacteraceae bacterium]|nr:dethiobiotin synthase [Candidatus Competibacteraceae bacterium]
MNGYGFFITGTDTGVGKTVVSALLARAWGAEYWKPVQTGPAADHDTPTVARLAGVRCHAPVYALPEPLSPHEAARLAGVRIALEAIQPPVSERLLLVEGAGGVLVPLNEEHLMVDLMVRLGLPVIVVARSQLGTINHTLLSLAALRQAGCRIAGVVMNGPPNAANRRAIEHFGRVRVFAELAPLPVLEPGALALPAAGLPDWRSLL